MMFASPWWMGENREQDLTLVRRASELKTAVACSNLGKDARRKLFVWLHFAVAQL